HESRLRNHPYSQSSKTQVKTPSRQSHLSKPSPSVGDLVYLTTDRDKTRGRSRYLVTNIDKGWCFVRKFTGNQLRSLPYKVKLCACIPITNFYSDMTINPQEDSLSDDEVCTIPLSSPPDESLCVPTPHSPQIPDVIAEPPSENNMQSINYNPDPAVPADLPINSPVTTVDPAPQRPRRVH
ncbi:hypothetical protein LOTGIDRAFT_176515, partial [Lottia gigantea]